MNGPDHPDHPGLSLPPSEEDSTPTETITEWCGEASRYLVTNHAISMGDDARFVLMLRALAAAVGVTYDGFTRLCEIERMRQLKIMLDPEAIAFAKEQALRQRLMVAQPATPNGPVA